MKGKTRRKLEMGARAFLFSCVYPDPSPGYQALLARLEDRLKRATDLALQQRNGMSDVRAAAASKRDLRRMVRRAHLAHLAQVARMAEREIPELRHLFVLRRGTIPYLTFQSTAHGMAAEAENRREVLVQYGLADTVLESLARALEDFDRAAQRGRQGRLAHVGASAELDVIADEVVAIVKGMNGVNLVRFAHQPELLASWESVSHVAATPRAA
jgi:hypothetical protein